MEFPRSFHYSVGFLIPRTLQDPRSVVCGGPFASTGSCEAKGGCGGSRLSIPRNRGGMMKLWALLGALAPPLALAQDISGDCNIANLFSHLQMITESADCCPVGGCQTGFPGSADSCTTECGVVFEPFWDDVRGLRCVASAW